MGPAETAVMFFFGFVFASAGWLQASWSRRRLQQRVDMAIANDLPASAVVGRVRDQAPARARDERVEDLENQVDQIVGQLDRLVESQEFLSRIMTDRIDQLGDPRMNTPH